MATEAERQAVWNIKAGEVHIAFRKSACAFGAVTSALAKLAEQKPAIAKAIAREIARSLGVIRQARELSDDDLEDRAAFRKFVRAVSGLPISEADRLAIMSDAKTKDVVTDAIRR